MQQKQVAKATPGAQKSAVLNLRSRKNRNRLRRAGFSEPEIEQLFVHLEKLVIVPVAWREAATNRSEGEEIFPEVITISGRVHAAEAEVRA